MRIQYRVKTPAGSSNVFAAGFIRYVCDGTLDGFNKLFSLIDSVILISAYPLPWGKIFIVIEYLCRMFI